MKSGTNRGGDQEFKPGLQGPRGEGGKKKKGLHTSISNPVPQKEKRGGEKKGRDSDGSSNRPGPSNKRSTKKICRSRSAAKGKKRRFPAAAGPASIFHRPRLKRRKKKEKGGTVQSPRNGPEGRPMGPPPGTGEKKRKKGKEKEGRRPASATRSRTPRRSR